MASDATGPAEVNADRVYAQGYEMLRSLHQTMVTESTVLSILLVTMVGFGVERRSWGIAAAAAIALLAKWQVLRQWRKRAGAMLELLGGMEPVDVRLADALGASHEEFTTRRTHVRLIGIVGVVHVGVVVYLVGWTDWTFAGS